MDQTNCHNCGAPITGPECEYCGTRFNIRVVDEPITFTFGVTSSEFINSAVACGFMSINEARRRTGLNEL